MDKDKYEVELYCTNCDDRNPVTINRGTSKSEYLKHNSLCKNCGCVGFLE